MNAERLVTISFKLPDWVDALLERKAYPGAEDKMALCLNLLHAQVEEGDGGPFAAIVFDKSSHQPVVAGVNLVVPGKSSLLHAEVVAILLAQQQLGTWDLSGNEQKLSLVTSAQPCIQCFGAIWWSGLSELIYGATAKDVEGILGFSEGPVPNDWNTKLSSRSKGIATQVLGPINREEACIPLRRYVELGKTIYAPGSSYG